MKFTRKKPFACHECQKNIFKEKNPRRNYETLLKFSQRWENIHCKINHQKITFSTTFLDIWHYFLDWSHGTRFRIDTWTRSFTFHFVSIRRHIAHHSTFYFEAQCIGISDSNTIEIFVDSTFWCIVILISSYFQSLHLIYTLCLSHCMFLWGVK